MSPLCTIVLEYLETFKDNAEEWPLLIECLAPVLLGDSQLMRAAVVAACMAGRGTEVVALCSEHAEDVRTRQLTQKAIIE